MRKTTLFIAAITAAAGLFANEVPIETVKQSLNRIGVTNIKTNTVPALFKDGKPAGEETPTEKKSKNREIIYRLF